MTLKNGGTQKANHEHTRRLHEQGRNGQQFPDLDEPELAAAWRSLQLHWLATMPAYREKVRARVSEAAKNAERMQRRVDASHRDIDYLGRGVEGCG